MLLGAAAAAAKVLRSPGPVLAPQILQAGGHVVLAGGDLAEEAERGRLLLHLLLPLQAALPRLQAAAAFAPLLALALLLLLLLLGRRVGLRRGETASLRLPGRLLVVAGRLILLVVLRRAAGERRGRARRGERGPDALNLHGCCPGVCGGRQCAGSARERVLRSPRRAFRAPWRECCEMPASAAGGRLGTAAAMAGETMQAGGSGRGARGSPSWEPAGRRRRRQAVPQAAALVRACPSCVALGPHRSAILVFT